MTIILKYKNNVFFAIFLLFTLLFANFEKMFF